MINETKIIDCHVHVSRQTDIKYLADFLTRTGTEMASINACTHSRCITLVPQAMMLKKLQPGRFYVLAAPDMSAYYLHADDLGEYMAEYGEKLMEMGCDGIKMLEGKPQIRKKYPIPDFDLPVWDKFWTWAERREVPILWHVNDPEDFWDKENAPPFAVSQGWLYDESYVNNEAQYTQVLNVLERHPKLKICFAHFFFMSAQLERLAGILDKYENVMVDLTPGIEMYENFSANFEAAKSFFNKYSKRICYGTDIGGRCIISGEGKEFDELENLRRPEIVRSFLCDSGEIVISSDGHYLIKRPDFTMRCFALEGESLSNIMHGNFARFCGETPKDVNEKAVLEECARLRTVMDILEKTLPDFSGDRSLAAQAEKFFG